MFQAQLFLQIRTRGGMVDAADLKSADLVVVGVRVPSCLLFLTKRLKLKKEI